MDERSAVIGLLALALLALLVPRLVERAAGLLRPPAIHIYAAATGGGAPVLWWTPAAGSPAAPPAEAGSAGPGAQPEPAVGGAAGLLLGYPLDLNRASLDDLQALPGIGPKTAAAILQARQELGGFATVDDLLRVRGVGPKTLATLRPWVRVASDLTPPTAARSP